MLQERKENRIIANSNDTNCFDLIPSNTDNELTHLINTRNPEILGSSSYDESWWIDDISFKWMGGFKKTKKGSYSKKNIK